MLLPQPATLLAVVKTIPDALTTLLPVPETFAGELKTLPAAVKTISGVLTMLLPLLTTFAGGLTTLSAVMKTFSDVVQKFLAGVKTFSVEGKNIFSVKPACQTLACAVAGRNI